MFNFMIRMLLQKVNIGTINDYSATYIQNQKNNAIWQIALKI